CTLTFNIRFQDGRMPAMWNGKLIIKPSKQRIFLINSLMLKYTEQLLFKRNLFYSIKMIKRSLRSPTNIQCGSNMLSCPIKYHTNFIPISNLFELQHFYRGTCDNHSIIVISLNFIEALIEYLQMLLGCIFRDIGI